MSPERIIKTWGEISLLVVNQRLKSHHRASLTECPTDGLEKERQELERKTWVTGGMWTRAWEDTLVKVNSK